MSTDTLTNELIARWIEQNPHRPSAAEAWVLPRCVSVWAVIGQIDLEAGRLDTVADDYDLPLDAVRAAVAYYERNRQAVDERIAANRAFFA